MWVHSLILKFYSNKLWEIGLESIFSAIKVYILQIQSFIDNLGLKASTRKAAKDKKKMNESPDEQTQQRETPQTTTPTTVHLDKQLMSVSAKPLKRMLVSIDTEQMWYDQVSPSAVIVPTKKNNFCSAKLLQMQSLYVMRLNYYYNLILQSESTEPTDAVSLRVIVHLTKVGEELMASEISLYEKSK